MFLLNRINRIYRMSRLGKRFVVGGIMGVALGMLMMPNQYPKNYNKIRYGLRKSMKMLNSFKNLIR